MKEEDEWHEHEATSWSLVIDHVQETRNGKLEPALAARCSTTMAAILRPIVRFSSPLHLRETVASSHSVRRPLVSDRQRSLLRTCKRDFHASVPYTTAPKSQSLLLRNFRHLRTCEPPCRRVARMQKYIQRRFLSEFREKPTSNQPEPSPWTGIDPRVKIATVLLSIAALYYLFQ